MARLPVDSSSLKSVDYNALEQALEVEFHHGAVYVYLDVPPDVFEELKAAESKGRFFNANIRDVYTHAKLRRKKSEPEVFFKHLLSACNRCFLCRLQLESLTRRRKGATKPQARGGK